MPSFRATACSQAVTGFFSIRFATSHAKEMAFYLEHVFGFHKIAYRGLETGSPCIACHVMQCNGIVFEVVNTVEVPEKPATPRDYKLWTDMAGSLINFAKGSSKVLDYASSRRAIELYAQGKRSEGDTVQSIVDAHTAAFLSGFVHRHGMGVCDVMFSVQDAFAVYTNAITNGAVSVQRPHAFRDVNGSVVTAVIGSPHSDLRHTFVQNLGYSGPYLPGYQEPKRMRPRALVIQPNLLAIDHCVQNFSWNQMTQVADFYKKTLGFHKFWSIDEKEVSTGDTGLRSVVVANANEMVKMPINEPAKVRLRGQIEEFFDFFGGPGVQHVALRTDHILETVVFLRSRGLEFNEVSPEYYSGLSRRLKLHNIWLEEDFEELKENHILVDFDPNGKCRTRAGHFSCNYMLQIFTKPIHDKPTFFIEIIQRCNHNGFGKGAFKGLFESIEKQQKERGTLGHPE